jgi:L-lactate dehydrogenase
MKLMHAPRRRGALEKRKMRQVRIVIVGAGLVGGSAALLAAVAIPGADIILVDAERVRAQAQALDLAHATASWGHDSVRAGDYEDARDADIVVITAGAGVKPGPSRPDPVQVSARMLDDIIDSVAPLAPEAVYVIASNPCDVLAAHALRRLGCARERVISTGTSLDTARLRAMLSKRLGVATPAIDAFVVGEHGDSSLIHWSGALVAGVPLEDYLERSGSELGPASRGLMMRSVHDAGRLSREGKSATHYGIGSCIARICQAIAHNSNLVLPVAVVHAEVEGVRDVCVSLPMVVNAGGAHLPAYPTMDADEREALQQSARMVKDVTDRIAARPAEKVA